MTGKYGVLYALNKADGKLLWKYDSGSPPGYASPSVSGDVVYFGGSDYVYAVSNSA